MITKQVEVTVTVDVTVDETKFNDLFMSGFREVMYNFNSIDDHLKHLAQMEVRGFIPYGNPFIEGYGKMNGMGISMELTDQEESIIGN